ncbi:unnamed protein product, partial [Ixodes hexagonus]
GVGITLLTVSIILAMYFNRYRGIALGCKYAGWSCSGIVFPKLLSYLEQEYGFRDTLLIIGAISLNIPVLTLLLKEPPWMSLKVTKKDTSVRHKTSSGNYTSKPIDSAQEEERTGCLISKRPTDDSSTLGFLRRPIFF